MLAAHAVGLDYCWIGSTGSLFNSAKRGEYLEKLQIPHEYSPSHIILIGEKDSNPTTAPTRKENAVNYIE